VFRGLDQRNFDTWLGNPKGSVTDLAFSTLLKNAIAAKGVRGLGARDLGSAILEFKLGKGRILASQLNASSLHDTDSSAAVYFVNLLRYAAGDGEYWKDTLKFAMNRQDSYETAKGKCRVIPLEKYVTTSFRDDIADDRKGGWTDQGKNDFRDVKTGMTTAAGIPFRIIDPAQNNGNPVLCCAERTALIFRNRSKESGLEDISPACSFFILQHGETAIHAPFTGSIMMMELIVIIR
jgi:beta-galactosidase